MCRRMGKGPYKLARSAGIAGYSMGRLASGRCYWLRHRLSGVGMVQVEVCLGVSAMHGMCKAKGGSIAGAVRTCALV